MKSSMTADRHLGKLQRHSAVCLRQHGFLVHLSFPTSSHHHHHHHQRLTCKCVCSCYSESWSLSAQLTRRMTVTASNSSPPHPPRMPLPWKRRTEQRWMRMAGGNCGLKRRCDNKQVFSLLVAITDTYTERPSSDSLTSSLSESRVKTGLRYDSLDKIASRRIVVSYRDTSPTQLFSSCV